LLVSNWNNCPRVEAAMRSFRSQEEARDILGQTDRCIPRGLGRSYGDCSLGENIISTPGFRRFIHLDPAKGILECEAGTSLDQILSVIIPHGWFLPVTPGTSRVTLGGAIASDVHGKNHHLHGALGRHVLDLRLLTPQGHVLVCSKNENPAIFQAVCGGMGLLGLILSARISLMPLESVFIRQKTIPAYDLDELMSFFDSHHQSTYTVAWMDCLQRGRHLGRGLFMHGEHCRSHEAPQSQLIPPGCKGISIPFTLPFRALTPAGIKAFNSLYFHRKSRRTGYEISSIESFFYPLDALSNWNLLYGKKGFLQYQFVLPRSTSRSGLQKILQHINSFGQPPYLAVLKLLGKGQGPLSFAQPGYTLALDFPIRPGVFSLLNALDRVVQKLGGRIYLAKDARMKKHMLWEGYPRAKEFVELKKRLDPENKLSSLQSRRLGLCQNPY